jgi:hypothetical protein
MKQLMVNSVKFAVAGCLIATAFTAVAAAGPVASKQRIQITQKQANQNGFVLTTLSKGPLAGDSGTVSFCCWGDIPGMRDGQSFDIGKPLATFRGKLGTFFYRANIQWVDAGNGYGVGTGTWRIVGGTGAYKHLEGGGRTAVSQAPDDNTISFESQGLVDLGRCQRARVS